MVRHWEFSPQSGGEVKTHRMVPLARFPTLTEIGEPAKSDQKTI